MTGLVREDAKAVNFAKIFGAGVRKFAEMIGKPLAEAQKIYAPVRSKSAIRFAPLASLSARSQSARLHRAL